MSKQPSLNELSNRVKLPPTVEGEDPLGVAEEASKGPAPSPAVLSCRDASGDGITSVPVIAFRDETPPFRTYAS